MEPKQEYGFVGTTIGGVGVGITIGGVGVTGGKGIWQAAVTVFPTFVPGAWP